VRNRGGAVVSVIGHMLFIGLTVMATRESLNARGPEEERLVPLPVLPPTDQPRRPVTSAPQRTPAPSRSDLPAAPAMQVPVIIPDHIPDIDLGAPARGGIEWRTDERPGGIGIPSNAAGGLEDGIPFAPGVDKPAIAHAGNPSPRYPDILRRGAVRGIVVVQVVIDTTGRADMGSVRIVSSDHPLFTDAVLQALPRARFLPAESAGRKVRMWAVQSFVFEVR
jgi:protein TonB